MSNDEMKSTLTIDTSAGRNHRMSGHLRGRGRPAVAVRDLIGNSADPPPLDVRGRAVRRTVATAAVLKASSVVDIGAGEGATVDSQTGRHMPLTLAAPTQVSHCDGTVIFLIQVAEVGTVRWCRTMHRVLPWPRVRRVLKHRRRPAPGRDGAACGFVWL